MRPELLLAAAHGSATTAQDISVGHVLLQMVVALGIVIGGIWGFGKILRRGARGRRKTSATRGRGVPQGLTVLSRQAVGKGKSIAVVQAGEQCFLVGIGDSGLTPLGELKSTDADKVDGVPGAGAGISGERAFPLAPGPSGTPVRALAPLGLGLGAIDLSDTSAHGPSGPPTTRSWFESLREATVRR